MGCNASKAMAVQPVEELHSKTQRENKAPVPNSQSRLALDTMHEGFKEKGDLTASVVRLVSPNGKSIHDVYDGVRDGKHLGSGAFGKVRKATHRTTGIECAVKCMQLNRFPTKEAFNQLRDEIRFMCQLDHPSIVRIHEVYESHNEVFIVQELCKGGDLFARVEDALEQADKMGNYSLCLSEAQCAKFVKQMLSAIQYLHSNGIVHRDLKLENFLFPTQDCMELRMIDFGLARHLDSSGSICGVAGSVYTAAPEVLLGKAYNEKVDIWSIGILAFLLLDGDTPFGSLDEHSRTRSYTFRREICNAPLVFKPAETWAQVSDEGKGFIRRLLCKNPQQRPSAAEALQDAWITRWTEDSTLENAQLSPETFRSLVGFKQSSEIQKFLAEILSYTLFPEQLAELRCEFAKIDKHGTGVISLESLKQVLLHGSRDSCWALTEHEVDEIFDSLKVTKSQTKIHWHEFVAAGMSMSKVDERNIRIAFERLDETDSGFLTFDGLISILGTSGAKEKLKESWLSSARYLEIAADKIYYQDFKKLIEGGMKFEVKRQVERSVPLAAHTGDTYDDLLHEVTQSRLIATREVFSQRRDLFLPTLDQNMVDSARDRSSP